MARVLVGSVADEPMVRKGNQLQYMLRPRFTPLQNPLRSTATAKSLPRTQQKSVNELVGRVPGGQTVPEDGKWYELMIKGDNGITRYQVMINPNEDGHKIGHLKYTVTNWDGTQQNVDKSFTPNYHNRALVSSVFQKYNSKNNKYRPVKGEFFLDKFSEGADTDEDIMRFNTLYK